MEKCEWCGKQRGNGDLGGCSKNLKPHMHIAERYAILFPGCGPQLVGTYIVPGGRPDGLCLAEHSYGTMQ